MLRRLKACLLSQLVYAAWMTLGLMLMVKLGIIRIPKPDAAGQPGDAGPGVFGWIWLVAGAVLMLAVYVRVMRSWRPK